MSEHLQMTGSYTHRGIDFWSMFDHLRLIKKEDIREVREQFSLNDSAPVLRDFILLMCCFHQEPEVSFLSVLENS